jgi:predicted DNA-binding protein YlxM (UPF0122 family)
MFYMLSLLFTFHLNTTQALSQTETQKDKCQKNVMVYFDASHSMIENVGGEAIMQFMLRFMKEAANNEELLKNGDLLILKKFVEKSYPFHEIGGQFEVNDTNRSESVERIDDCLYRYEDIKIRAEHNNYINLLEDIRQQILSTPPRGQIMNYVVIFSDFLYDPPYGRDQLIKHKTDLETQLFQYRDFFDNYKYRLILIYKKNPIIVKKGIDVFDTFNRVKYSKSIISPENIAHLIEDLKKEIIQPIRAVPDQSRFLYEKGSLSLKVALENPNCEEIRAGKMEIESITGADNYAITLASRSFGPEGTTIFKPLSSNTVDIKLNGTPSFREIIGNGYNNKTYEISYSIETNWGTTQDSVQLPLKDEDFIENFEVEIEDMVFVDHIFKAFDRLFIKLKFDGNLFDRAKLTISPEMENFTFSPIEPILPINFNTDEKLSDRNQIVVYKAKQNGDFSLPTLRSGEKNLSLKWSLAHEDKTIDLNFKGTPNSNHTLNKKIESNHYRSFVFLEILLFSLLIIMSIVIRIYFNQKRGEQINAINRR